MWAAPLLFFCFGSSTSKSRLVIREGRVTLSERNVSRSLGSGQQGASTPRLSEGTELFGEYEGSGFKEQVYLARRADGQVVQLSRLLYLVAAEADGQKDFGQIAQRVSAKFGRTVSADNVRFLVEEKLRPLGMIAVADGSSSPDMLARAKPVLALHWRAPTIPEGLVRALTTVFRPLFFAPVVIAALVALATFDFWLFFVHGIVEGVSETLYQPELFLMVIGLSLLSMLFHEVGHATACRYGGAKPGSIGVGIYLVWLIFYNDVTDTYRLGRAARLRTDLGGIYFNGILSLVIAGAYFLTRFEPLLIVILIQQAQMLYQFVPFVRLDGYYVVSDLTGVPDLFARIKPILRSMIPGRGMDGRVQELKPWVRVVVGAWVLTAIPALLCLFAWLVLSAPLMYAEAWNSFFVHYDRVWEAFRDGKLVDIFAGLLQILLLVIPVAGITLIFASVGTRLSVAAWRWSVGRHFHNRHSPDISRRGKRHPQGFTLERAAQLIDELPSDTSRESALRIVRRTLAAAGVEIEELDRSTQAQVRTLSTEIELARNRQKKLWEKTEEVIHFLEAEIRKARENYEAMFVEEERELARASKELEYIKRTRAFFSFVPVQKEQSTGTNGEGQR